MFKRKAKQKAAASAEASAQAAKTTPLMLEGPKAPSGPAAPVRASFLDLDALAAHKGDAAAPAAETASADSATPEQASRWRLPAYAPLAAAVAAAIALGAIAGAAATGALMRDAEETTAITAATADATRALQDTVAQLTAELAALKSGLATAQRSASAQVGKLAERLDRAEKAQAEPAAKIARLQESVDRLDQRQQQAAAAPEITNSVPAPKEESKPVVAEGWRLRDFYDGRAVVENRSGTLFRVGPGSNVPGLGKVETIKRENGKVVVVTASGTIAASLEPRRPSYYLPFRW